MCGLVDVISLNKQGSVIESMLEVLRYRGPDDTGTLVETVANSFVHLGQNRLSIQDVSKKGHQLFLNPLHVMFLEVKTCFVKFVLLYSIHVKCSANYPAKD